VAFDSNAFDVNAFDELAFLFDGSAATPEPTTQTPAGRSKHRRRYFVEIDGQQFDVQSVEQAQELLSRTRALADQAAEKAAEVVETKRKPKPKVAPVKLEAPKIKASPELKLDLSSTQDAINRAFKNAEIALEMRLLLNRAAEQDEEEAIFLLM
jgi:hypothetical protein